MKQVMRHPRKTTLALVAFVSLVNAADVSVADAARNRDVIAVKALVAQGADVNAAQTDGTTALDWAAHWEDAEMVAALIRARANVNAANRYGYTPLLEAATSGDAAIVKSLLEAVVRDANAALSTGQTALMFAARNAGHVEAIRALLDGGAAVNAKEKLRGQTALMWAAAEKHAAAVKLLIERGAEVNAHADVYREQPKMSPTQGIILNGMTALHFAARQNDIESMKVLSSRRARRLTM